MAYSLYEETHLNSPKSSQYYPEEYDYSYFHKISEGKSNYFIDPSSKKNKRVPPSINYINERKCPIYVHQYNRVQSISTYNNYPSSKPISKPSTEKNYSKPKKILGYPTTKSVLDQLEESYWATWKPNKENISNMTKKNRTLDSRINKIEAYGDVPDSGTNYYDSTDYESSAASGIAESDHEKYKAKYETVIDMTEISERKHSKRTKMKAHEIQTDNAPLLPKIEENTQNEEVTKKEQFEIVEEPVSEKLEEKENRIEKTSDEEPEISAKEKSKLLKHTDSFIIHKKKQSEVREHFQQPKCIRLYRKTGISSSFIRGGSYPLRSCLKREPAPKGNFRLGAPGSPLFVSTSSFHKKSKNLLN